MKIKLSPSFIIICFLSVFISCGQTENKPIKTLIVTGQNNHNWQVSHLILRQVLENSGLFTVDIALSPMQGEDMSNFSPDFNEYQVVVLDYNGDNWPDETNQNFLDYVQNGGGVVIYHAANNAFPDWQEYNRITALGGWNGRDENSGPYLYMQDGKVISDSSPGPGGSHGPAHEFVLESVCNDHPITRGLPKAWLHATDELYDQMRGPGNIKDVLYTAYSSPGQAGTERDEILVFTVDYGRARIFHLMLGHAGPTEDESPGMQCTGFQVLLLRGTEWAATGKVMQPVPEDFPEIDKISLRKNFKY